MPYSGYIAYDELIQSISKTAFGGTATLISSSNIYNSDLNFTTISAALGATYDSYFYSIYALEFDNGKIAYYDEPTSCTIKVLISDESVARTIELTKGCHEDVNGAGVEYAIDVDAVLRGPFVFTDAKGQEKELK